MTKTRSPEKVQLIELPWKYLTHHYHNFRSDLKINISVTKRVRTKIHPPPPFETCFFAHLHVTNIDKKPFLKVFVGCWQNRDTFLGNAEQQNPTLGKSTWKCFQLIECTGSGTYWAEYINKNAFPCVFGFCRRRTLEHWNRYWRRVTFFQHCLLRIWVPFEARSFV